MKKSSNFEEQIKNLFKNKRNRLFSRIREYLEDLVIRNGCENVNDLTDLIQRDKELSETDFCIAIPMVSSFVYNHSPMFLLGKLCHKENCTRFDLRTGVQQFQRIHERT